MKLDVTLQTRSYLAQLDSSAGAVCYRLYHRETASEILRTPSSEDELEQNRFLFGNPILFPPNRIRGGSFTFEGRQYDFPVNEPETGSHLHGALYRLPFETESLSENEAVFIYRADAGEYLGFPHAFQVRRHYTLTDVGGLEEVTEIYNNSELNMPVMLAYHTTFRIPFCGDGRTEDHLLTLPVRLLHKRDEHFLPTCEYEDGSLCETLRNGTFVPCEHTVSAFFEANGSTMRLYDRSKKLAVEYRTQGFGYWMLYNGGNRDLLVVEPQTCAIDAFHIDRPYAQAGVLSLPPHEKISFITNIVVQNQIDIS